MANIKYAAELPKDVPSSLTVYKLTPPQATTTQVATVSQRFGLTGRVKEFIQSEDWTSYQEGRFRVSVHRNSGAVRYINRDKFGKEPEKDFKLKPKDSERIAQEFLRGTKVFPDKQVRLHKITHLRSAVSDIEGKEKIERLIDAGVIYRRVVDETPVEGPGGYTMVNIDPDSEVVGMRSIWRQTAARETKVKIIPVAQAVETFERLVADVQGELTVRTASFGYFEQGELDRQTYLEPAYVFIYVVQNGEVAHKSIEVIAAGQQAFAKFKGKKRFDPGQQQKRPPDKKAGKRG